MHEYSASDIYSGKFHNRLGLASSLSRCMYPRGITESGGISICTTSDLHTNTIPEMSQQTSNMPNTDPLLKERVQHWREDVATCKLEMVGQQKENPGESREQLRKRAMKMIEGRIARVQVEKGVGGQAAK
jgi:hypothetical protein